MDIIDFKAITKNILITGS